MPDDELIRALVAPRLVPQRRLPPWALRSRQADRLPSLPATVRVIARAHSRPAYRRANAQVPLPAGLAKLDIGVVGVADLTDRGITRLPDQSHLARRQTDGGVDAFFAQHLSGGPGRANELAAASFLELDVVNQRAERNARQRQAVARPDLSLGPGHELVADLQS